MQITDRQNLPGLDSRGSLVVGGVAIWSLIGVVVLKDVPIGISWAFWLIGTLAGAAGMSRFSALKLPSGSWFMLGIAATALAFLGIRESATLRALDLFIAFTAVVIAASMKFDLALATERPMRWIQATMASTGVLTADAFCLVAQCLPWKEWRATGTAKRMGPVVRGLLFLVPALLIFGGLLSSADDVFRTQIEAATHWDATTLMSSVAWFVGLTWLSGGLVYRLALAQRSPIQQISAPMFQTEQLSVPPVIQTGTKPTVQAPNLVTEVAIVMGGLNALFAAFVFIQIRYLFGSADLIQTVPGLTYAEYARKGFFELVAAIALAAPVMLGAESIVKMRHPDGLGWFRRMQVAMATLLAVMAASGIKRMLLYIEAYGLTEPRVYSAAFMVGAGLCVVWFALAQYGKRPQLVPVAASIFFAIALGLNVMNADRMIAAYNLDRAVRTGEFDQNTVASLSLDALPVVREHAAKAPAAVKPAFESVAQSMETGMWNRDPRAWTLGFARAYAVSQSPKLTADSR